MGTIKITYQIYVENPMMSKPRKRKPYPTCKQCGARLKDEKSIKRGYGHKCFSKKPAMIILNIQPGEAQP